MKKKQKGFSLLEMLVVLVVIAMVTAIAVPNLVKTAQMQAQSGAKRRVLATYSVIGQGISCTMQGGNCNAINALVPPINTPVVAAGYSYVFSGVQGDGSWTYTATPITPGPAAGMAVIQTTNQGGLTCNGSAC